jgi:hypothetical protein
LDADGVRALLRAGALGVIANVGERLRWLSGAELADWWKDEASSRLVDPGLQTWLLESFPDERCWRASEWTLDDGTTAVSFEECH